jgi:hypothetical protein
MRALPSPREIAAQDAVSSPKKPSPWPEGSGTAEEIEKLKKLYPEYVRDDGEYAPPVRLHCFDGDNY